MTRSLLVTLTGCLALLMAPPALAQTKLIPAPEVAPSFQQPHAAPNREAEQAAARYPLTPSLRALLSQYDLPEPNVAAIITTARDNLHQFKMPDGSSLPPETPEERTRPLLPERDALRVIETGVRTALLEWCGGNWEANYLNFMRNEEEGKRWSTRQLGYMIMLHGVTQGAYTAALQQKGSCPPMLQQQLAPAVEM
jgi:hypothetical protein